MARILEPTVLNTAIRGVGYENPAQYLPDTDILGRPRFMGTVSASTYGTGTTLNPHPNGLDIGPYSLNNVLATGSAPSSSGQTFKITDEGMMVFPIAVSSSTSITASIGIKHEKGAGAEVKPQLILRYAEHNTTSSAVSNYEGNYQTGSSLYIDSTISQLNDNTWGTITASHAFGANSSAELEVVVYNRQSGSDSITSFCELEIE